MFFGLKSANFNVICGLLFSDGMKRGKREEKGVNLCENKEEMAHPPNGRKERKKEKKKGSGGG